MPPYPKRGEVFLARLDKLRPVIILSVDSLNRQALDVSIVPVTTKEHAKFSMRIPLKAGDGGLDRDGWAKCDQITTLEKSLLKYPAIGLLPAEKFASVQEQVKVALGLL
ncbi:MAG: type II toxin-antitoxin system PemK/MazF family toxin [Terriglobia bacterium]